MHFGNKIDNPWNVNNFLCLINDLVNFCDVKIFPLDFYI